MKKLGFILTLVGCLGLLFDCANSELTGSSASKKKSDEDKPSKEDDDPIEEDQTDAQDGDESDQGGDSADATTGEDEAATDGDVDEESAEDQPEGLEEDGVVGTRAAIDFATCVLRPQGGLQHKGKCPANHVLPGTNDGKGVWIHCCPLKGKNILSKKESELFVQRAGFCEANEVVVGMDTPDAPAVIYCSKINTKYLKLSEQVPAPFSEAGSATGGVQQLLNTYAQVGAEGDACMCPDDAIYVGGRANEDGACPNDKCAYIKKK